MAENGPFGTPFLIPKIRPKKFMWVPFRVLSQEMRHINFILGGRKCFLGVGDKKFMLKKFMCYFGPLISFEKSGAQTLTPKHNPLNLKRDIALPWDLGAVTANLDPHPPELPKCCLLVFLRGFGDFPVRCLRHTSRVLHMLRPP